MSKSIEEIALEAAEEMKTPGFAEMIKDPVNFKLLEVLAEIAPMKEGKGPMEYSIFMGRKCYEIGKEEGREEMKKEIAEKVK